MRRKIGLITVIVALIAIAAIAAGCVDSDTPAYTIKLDPASAEAYYDASLGVYVFEAGKVDWSAFRFILYDSEGNALEEVTVTTSMIEPDVIASTEAARTVSVRVMYQGASLYIPIKTYMVSEVATYYVTYNAGAGAAFPDDASGEAYTDDTGSVIWRIGYYGGKVDTVATPERVGYTFKGWYTSAEFSSGTLFTAGRTIARDTVVYACWSDIRSFDVRFTAYRDGDNWGLVENRTGIEYGTSITFPAPVSDVQYEFVNYTVSVFDDNGNTVETLVFDEPGATYTVYNDLSVRINYTIKMVTLTYLVEREDTPWAVEGAEQFGVPIVKTSINFDGKPVEGYAYIFSVAYGTKLQSDVEPVPEVPAVAGATGVWLDAATGRTPLYGSVSEDRRFIAQYTDSVFTMRFWLDEEQTVPAKDTTGAQITRTAKYNECISSVPGVPEKAGHTGTWYVRTEGGNLEYAVLDTIRMTRDYDVVARYTANSYIVSYYLSPANSQSPSLLASYSIQYGDEVSPGIDILNRIETEYPFDVFELIWYSSSGKTPSSVVSFPRNVENDISFYAEPVRKPYTVVFRSPAGAPYAAFETTQLVQPDDNGNAIVKVPEVTIDGYDVNYWYYYDVSGLDSLDSYDPASAYGAGDRVVHLNTVFKAIKDVPAGAGAEPPNLSYWTSDMPSTTQIYQSAGTFTVNCSHVYDPDVRYDTAIYASAMPKTYPANFYRVVYTGSAQTGYSVSFELQTSLNVKYDSFVANVPSPTVPGYPDYVEGGGVAQGDFVFEGWYLDPSYVRAVDPASYRINGNVDFYAKWTDKLLGTEGLVYEPIYDDSGNITAYKVTGFASAAEEFSTLSVYIPETHLNKPVTTLGAGAFAGFDSLLFITELSLPDNLTVIEDNAFKGLSSLSNVVYDGTAFAFGNGALTSADGKTLYLYLPVAADDSYVLPAGVERIAGGAFANNRNLTDVDLDNGVLKEIGAYAFDGDDSLEYVSLPASLQTVGEYAFRYCISLQSVTIAEASEVVAIGKGAFDNAYEALERDGYYLRLGSALIRYEGSAKELILSDEFSCIAAGAFAGTVVESLTIGASSALESISADAFAEAFYLEKISILKSEKVAAEAGAFEGVALDAELYVLSSVADEYSSDEVYAEAFGTDIYPLD